MFLVFQIRCCFLSQRNFIYDIDFRNSIQLLLRRTLVRSLILFIFIPPQFEKSFLSNYFPRQRGTTTIPNFYSFFLAHSLIPPVLLSILLILMAQLLLLTHFACFETSLHFSLVYIPIATLSPLSRFC